MSSDLLPTKIGSLVRLLRHKAGVSQEEFAHRCEIHRTYLGAIERGEKSISVETAEKVAKGFGLSLAQFFKELEK